MGGWGENRLSCVLSKERVNKCTLQYIYYILTSRICMIRINTLLWRPKLQCPFFLGLENTCKEFVEKFKFEVCCA